MQRQIEFRVWDKVEKEFVPFAWIDAISWQMQTPNPKEEYVFQEYTGLRDKKGKKIFEGDVLCENHDGGEGEANIGQVYFVAGTFMIDGDGPLYDHTFSLTPDILEDYTVIGNIFENHELLKQ